MNALNVSILRTEELDDATVEDIYDELLVPAFPPEELVDRTIFRASYRVTVTVPGLVAFDGGKLVGVAVGERHEPSGIALLAYLAVSRSQRNRGVGSALMERLMRSWGADPATAAVVAEVEDPRVHVATEYGDPVARLRFYQRCGARLLSIDYFQPRLKPHLPRVDGMMLLSILDQRPSLSPRALMSFLDDYFVEAEESLPTDDDTQYAALRQSVERHGNSVRTLPICEDLYR